MQKSCSKALPVFCERWELVHELLETCSQQWKERKYCKDDKCKKNGWGGTMVAHNTIRSH